jgi:hypothetical protein
MTDKQQPDIPQEEAGGTMTSSGSPAQIPQFDRIQAIIQPAVETCYQIWNDHSNLSQQLFTTYLVQSVALAQQQFSMTAQTPPPDNVSIPRWQAIQPVLQQTLQACHSIWSASEDTITNQQFLSLLITSFSVIGLRYWRNKQDG